MHPCLEFNYFNLLKGLLSLQDCQNFVSQFYLKTTFPKSKPIETTYRNFKHFSEENFNQQLKKNLAEKRVKNYASFENVFMDTLNMHESLKKSKKIKSCHHI